MKGEAVMGREVVLAASGTGREKWRGRRGSGRLGGEMKKSPQEASTLMPEQSQLPPQLRLESPPNPTNDNGYRVRQAHVIFTAME